MVTVHEIQQTFRVFIELGTIALELAAALIIFWGALRAIYQFLRAHGHGKDRIRYDFGRLLLLGLDFLIGSDVLRVAATPELRQVGVVAIVVLIRVLLTFTLERELKQEKPGAEKEKQEGHSKSGTSHGGG